MAYGSAVWVSYIIILGVIVVFIVALVKLLIPFMLRRMSTHIVDIVADKAREKVEEARPLLRRG
jgi:cobalamin biosynthesis protein CobD/CbiB